MERYVLHQKYIMVPPSREPELSYFDSYPEAIFTLKQKLLMFTQFNPMGFFREIKLLWQLNRALKKFLDKGIETDIFIPLDMFGRTYWKISTSN